MSMMWPLPEDLRDPAHRDEYLADKVDEMTAGSLATLAEVRRRLAYALVWDSAATGRVTTEVDKYAREIIDRHADDDLPPHERRDDCVCEDCTT